MSGEERYRLLATFVVGRSMRVAVARPGDHAYTDGHVVYVSAEASADEQRRQVLVQSALLRAGSLDRRLVRELRARPSTARRYLALEGHRALASLAATVPAAAILCPSGAPTTTTAEMSLDVARRGTSIPDPPSWYGAIRPSRMASRRQERGATANDHELRLHLDAHRDDDDSDEGPSDESRILKLFEAPVAASRLLADFLGKLFGSSRSTGNDKPGAELSVGSTRRAAEAGAQARPMPTPIRFTDDGWQGGAAHVEGSLHPEWDVFTGGYRPDWCRVITFPLIAADVAAAAVVRDEVLRRRLSRVGLGPKILRRRPDGDDVDIEAVIDLSVDVRSGYSPNEHVYLESRKLARNLGVLIMVDASGSAVDTDTRGLAVLDHQRRAAATLAATLDELGDRVAVYAFRSQGRHAVHLPVIKTFGQRFGAAGRARLNTLRPSGYTRLGAGIRGAGQILKEAAGTPNRLLLILSDGFPYDDGYEGRYAEADAAKALEELRADGVACLCLSIGAATDTATLRRVFGAASHAGAATLDELSPRMDELFLSALGELAAPRTSRHRLSSC